MSDQQPCDYCGGPTTFATALQPLGGQSGHHVWFCEVCKRHGRIWESGSDARARGLMPKLIAVWPSKRVQFRTDIEGFVNREVVA